VSTDPLDYFYDITSRRSRVVDEDGPDYPGKTAPKNRGVDKVTHEWLHSVKSHEYSVGGTVTNFYTIGALAQALNRKPVTIRSWESKGWLPPASFRTPPPKGEQVPGKATKGRRLYSETQVVFLVEAAIEYQIDDPDSPDWDGFRSHIASHYPKH